MQNHWPTQQQDMQVAAEFIQEYAEKHNGAAPSVFKVTLRRQQAPEVSLSEWVTDLADYFCHEYGREYTETIMESVIAQCITAGKVVH